jgi:prepilin-type N-terminal cleavage/methylation domain-containing protein
MVTNNIKINKDRGFTIVELLVVIVVIGILAAITIVSYTGITTRAKNTKAQSNAQSVQNVAEVYAADNLAGNGYYPATAAAFASYTGATRLPAGLSVVPQSTALTTTNGDSTVTWACLTSCTNPTGGRITYFNFSTGAASETIVYVGAASASGTFANPTS